MGAERTPGLSRHTLTWLNNHPHAYQIVREVWDTLDDHDRGGRDTTALRKLLLKHQPTLFRNRCSGCRTRTGCHPIPFPCIIWHRITWDHAHITLGLLPSWSALGDEPLRRRSDSRG